MLMDQLAKLIVDNINLQKQIQDLETSRKMVKYLP